MRFSFRRVPQAAVIFLGLALVSHSQSPPSQPSIGCCFPPITKVGKHSIR